MTDYLKTGEQSNIKVFNPEISKNIFNGHLHLNQQYNADKILDLKSYKEFILEQFPVLQSNIKKMEGNFARLENMFFHMVHQTESPQDQLNKFMVKIDGLINVFFQEFDKAILNCQPLPIQNDAQLQDMFNMQQFRDILKGEIIKISDLLNDEFISQVTPLEFEKKVIKRIESIIRLYSFLRSDPSIICQYTHFKYGSLLENLTKNGRQDEPNYSQLLLLNLDAIMENTIDTEFDRTYPVFMHKKDLTVEKLHDILKDQDVNLPEINIKHIFKTVLNRERRKVYRQLYSGIMENMEEPTKDGKLMDAKQELEQIQKFVVDEMNTIKDQFLEMKQQNIYMEVISGRLTEKHIKDTSLHFNNMDFFIEIEKYIIKTHEFNKELTSQLNLILKLKKKEESYFKVTFGHILNKTIFKLTGEEHAISTNNGKHNLGELVRDQFQQLNKLIYQREQYIQEDNHQSKINDSVMQGNGKNKFLQNVDIYNQRNQLDNQKRHQMIQYKLQQDALKYNKAQEALLKEQQHLDKMRIEYPERIIPEQEDVGLNRLNNTYSNDLKAEVQQPSFQDSNKKPSAYDSIMDLRIGERVPQSEIEQAERKRLQQIEDDHNQLQKQKKEREERERLDREKERKEREEREKLKRMENDNEYKEKNERLKREQEEKRREREEQDRIKQEELKKKREIEQEEMLKKRQQQEEEANERKKRLQEEAEIKRKQRQEEDERRRQEDEIKRQREKEEREERERQKQIEREERERKYQQEQEEKERKRKIEQEERERKRKIEQEEKEKERIRLQKEREEREHREREEREERERQQKIEREEREQRERQQKLEREKQLEEQREKEKKEREQRELERQKRQKEEEERLRIEEEERKERLAQERIRELEQQEKKRKSKVDNIMANEFDLDDDDDLFASKQKTPKQEDDFDFGKKKANNYDDDFDDIDIDDDDDLYGSKDKKKVSDDYDEYGEDFEDYSVNLDEDKKSSKSKSKSKYNSKGLDDDDDVPTSKFSPQKGRMENVSNIQALDEIQSEIEDDKQSSVPSMEQYIQESHATMKSSYAYFEEDFDMLKATNEYILKTKWGKEQEKDINLEEMNNLDSFIQIFEEFIQLGTGFFFDFAHSESLFEVLQARVSQDEQVEELTDNFIYQLRSHYNNYTGKPDFEYDNLKVYFPFTPDNHFGLSLIEKNPYTKSLNLFFFEDMAQDPNTISLFDEFIQMIQEIIECYDVEQDQPVPWEVNSIKLSDPTVEYLYIQNADKYYVHYILLVFSLIYEKNQDNYEGPNVQIDKNTTQRVFYLIRGLTAIYDLIENNFQDLQDFFANMYEEQTKKYKDTVIFHRGDYYLEDGPEILQELIATDVDKLKQQKRPLSIALLKVQQSREEGEESYTFAYYLYVHKKPSSKQEIGIFTLENYGNEQNEMIEGIVQSFQDNNCIVKIERDFTRHNGLYDYCDLSFPLWCYLIKNKKLGPMEAISVLNFSMIPYYTVFKSID